jgi:hypothetical protein
MDFLAVHSLGRGHGSTIRGHLVVPKNIEGLLSRLYNLNTAEKLSNTDPTYVIGDQYNHSFQKRVLNCNCDCQPKNTSQLVSFSVLSASYYPYIGNGLGVNLGFSGGKYLRRVPDDTPSMLLLPAFARVGGPLRQVVFTGYARKPNSSWCNYRRNCVFVGHTWGSRSS